MPNHASPITQAKLYHYPKHETHSTFVQKPAHERFLRHGFLGVRVQEELSLDLRRREDSARVFDPGTLGGLGGHGGGGDDGGD